MKKVGTKEKEKEWVCLVMTSLKQSSGKGERLAINMEVLAIFMV